MPKTGLLALILALLLPGAPRAENTQFNTYSATFMAFVKSVNPQIPIIAAHDLACVNWTISNGDWAMARRLASMENNESGHFKLAAWMDYENTPIKKLYPRYDCLGSHVNLTCKEARKLGLYLGPFGVYTDEMDALLDRCAKDPAWGTWLVAHAYARMVRRFGLDRASHCWQTGKPYFSTREEYLTDPYLKSLRQGEAWFDTMIPGAPRKVATTKSRRKR